MDSVASRDGWQLVHEREQEPLECDPMQTAGWIVRENKAWLEVAQNIGAGVGGHSPQYCNIMTIPKRCVLRKKVLRAV